MRHRLPLTAYLNLETYFFTFFFRKTSGISSFDRLSVCRHRSWRYKQLFNIRMTSFRRVGKLVENSLDIMRIKHLLKLKAWLPETNPKSITDSSLFNKKIKQGSVTSITQYQHLGTVKLLSIYWHKSILGEGRVRSILFAVNVGYISTVLLN
jgi:hypothetical protein